MEEFTREVFVHEGTVTLDTVARHVETTELGSLRLLDGVRVLALLSLEDESGS